MSKQIRIELGLYSIQWFEKDPGPCCLCSEPVGEGPAGFSTDEPPGPLCDACLLRLDKQLGMVLWLALIAREISFKTLQAEADALAGAEAEAETEIEDDAARAVRYNTMLMSYAMLFDRGATWEHRQTAAVEFMDEVEKRLAQLPMLEFLKTKVTPPN